MEDRGDAVEETVVKFENTCSTRNAEVLCLEHLDEKLKRPNYYDIGGTFVNNITDYWFLFLTEQMGNVYVLHLFVQNRLESSFEIGFSCSQELHLNKKLNSYVYKDSMDLGTITYLTTYNFYEHTISNMEKSFYIPIKIKSIKAHKMLHRLKMGYNYCALLDNAVCSDFIIESSDNHKFHAHRAILAQHSQVFKAMLKEETAESINSHVKLSDVSKNDLRLMLEFIYTGSIADIEKANAVVLLMLADKYDLKGLYELSQHAMIRLLNVDNVVEVLCATDTFNLNHLKIIAMNFIKQNPAVFDSSAWKNFDCPTLIAEVCEYIVSQNNN